MKCLSDTVTYYMKRGATGALSCRFIKCILCYNFDLGIPSLNLRSIDPLFVKTMDIVQGNPSRGPVSLRIDMKNVTIVGYSDLKVRKVQ